MSEMSLRPFIHGMEVMLPHELLSSDEIETRIHDVYERLKISKGRIEFQTDIKTRGVFNRNFLPSSIAAVAAENLLSRYNIDPKKLDLLIYAGVCRDQLEPSTASRVHHLLNLPDSCQSFDLSNACLGFLNATQMAADLIRTGRYKNILVTTGENSRSLIDKTISKLNQNSEMTRRELKPLFANFTIGSMGVSALIATKPSVQDHSLEVLDSTSLSNSSAHRLCVGGGNVEDLVMETNSTELLTVGVELAKRTFQHLLDMGYYRENFHSFVCHQVGVAHQRAILDQLKLDYQKDYSTFAEFGNTGSAALPFTLYRLLNESNQALVPKKNDLLLLLGIASGVHCQLMVVKKC